jgi:integrase/recombinase XerD
MKLSKAIEGFVIARRAASYSNRTIEIYTWALDLLVSFLGDIDTEKITSQDLQRFMAWLHNDYQPTRGNRDISPLKPASVQNVWVGLRSFWNWALPELRLPGRPDTEIKRPKFQSPEIQPFSADEIKALLKACARTKSARTDRRQSFQMRRATADRDMAIILTLLDTGLRAGELCRLKVGQVNLDNGEVFVEPFGTGKKTKSRHVYIGRATIAAVWRYLAKRETHKDEPLFLTERGRELDRYSVRLVIDRMGERAGVANCHPHRFRHTFAIQYLRNGGDVFTLQRFLGHSSLEMVRRYIALSNADDANAHATASPVDRWRL